MVDVDADVRWEEEEGVEEVVVAMRWEEGVEEEVVAMFIIVLLCMAPDSWHSSPGRNTMLRQGLRTENMNRLSRGCVWRFPYHYS